MKKIAIISCWLLVPFFGSVHCQEVGDDLAIIYDTDGYVNVRSNPSITSSIIGKVITDDVLYFSPENIKNGWYPIKDQVQTEYTFLSLF